MLGKATWVVIRITEEPLLDIGLSQQVVILPIDLFPGDSRRESPVSSVSCVEAAAGKQYCASFAVTTKTDAPESVVITLFLLC